MLAAGDGDLSRAGVVSRCVEEFQASELYRTAATADAYDRGRNPTILAYQKTLTTLAGGRAPDLLAANHHCTSGFFGQFTTQLNQYLLGNGVQWQREDTRKRLGADFDIRLQEAGKFALVGGVCFGFWNYDHLEVFPVFDRRQGAFAPLFDEWTGRLAAGVRFWQVDRTKPRCATLYEPEGFANYLWSGPEHNPGPGWDRVDAGLWQQPRRGYLTTLRRGPEGVAVEQGNYPGLPIVPLWANPRRQSELVGLQEKIDAYDLVLNGFANDLDNQRLYWIIRGAAGMDDMDLEQFLDRLRTVGAAAPADGQEVDPVAVEIPYNAREALLQRLERQLYRDAMLLNPEDIIGGAATATQIRAAYERQNARADQFEYCVLEFLQGVLELAGARDTPTFTRSRVVNVAEEIQTVLAAAEYLPRDYVTGKVMTLLGDADLVPGAASHPPQGDQASPENGTERIP